MTEAAQSKSRSGSQTRKRKHMVTTAYDDAEIVELDEAASRAGITRASFQRVQSLQTPPKTRSTRRAPIDRELLAKTLGQFGKACGNLNQLTHAAHLGRTEQDMILATVKEIRGMLPLFMEALGSKA